MRDAIRASSEHISGVDRALGAERFGASGPDRPLQRIESEVGNYVHS